MQEAFLHFVWRYRRFDHQQLFTSEQRPLAILEIGEYNTDAGPDFRNAKIQLDETIWAGNIEIHIRASDWYRHRHDQDATYNSIILHVVWTEDRPIYRSSGERIPCLELESRIRPSLFKTYKNLTTLSQPIPCRHLIGGIEPDIVSLWLGRMAIERLQAKVHQLEPLLQKHRNDWEAVFYEQFVSHFGLQVNKPAFEQLAGCVPLALIGRYRDKLRMLEALLFGQAGFLNPVFKDPYPQTLQREYRYLAKLHQLTPMESVNWKFSRMRPSNFPTVRIAQLARLFFQSDHLFSKMLSVKEVKEVHHALNIQLADYWMDHYQFDQLSKPSRKRVGKTAIDLLIINVIAPILFLYGEQRAFPALKQQALDLLEQLPPENNTFIRDWDKLGIKPETAAQTQALLHLTKNYCFANRCLHCSIGVAILR